MNADINSAANIDASKLGTGLVSNTEFNYLDGVTSAIQTQFTGKVSKAGDTMTGTLNLPTNGLVAGTNQLVISGGNVGIGTTSPTSTLYVAGSQGFALNTITGNTTLTAAHSIVLANNSAAITITLPTVSTCAGRVYQIKKISSNNLTVTIDPAGAETIDGVLTSVLYVKSDSVTIASDGSSWHTIHETIQPHRAKMRRDTAQSIPASSSTIVDFNATEFDTGGLANLTTNRFTIQRTGQYRISGVWATAQALDAGESAWALINVDGINARWSNSHSSLADRMVITTVLDTIQLNAGQYIEFTIWHDEGAAMNTDTSAYYRPVMSVEEVR